MKLSGKDLAEKIGCARSTLSEATTNGHLVNGRWDVQEWAVCGPSGRLKHYQVPDEVAFLNTEKRENPAPNDPNSGNSGVLGGDQAPSADSATPNLGLPAISEMLEDHEETTRKVAEESGDKTQLVPDGTNVQGAVRNGGLAYAAGHAIQYDTPGALAFWTIGSALAGGTGGYAISDGNAWAALIGAVAFGGVGYLVYEQQPRRQEGVPPRRDERSGQDGQMNGASQRPRSAPTVKLDAINSLNTD